ncbi:hypothetical protein [Bradyrhizobium lablabi]|uniref:hypothetical protein n=1 Tax=Bradyrhizobium lablabi TaxID=722472 RepID=UPI00090CAFB6|nr:hypothetical protein [Bradyrhizobium lablabi]SHL47285.1 hypothetical protein SAMN05444321_3011 [Bradyrhizobium lablabi]
MNATTQLDDLSEKIANAIVNLVDQTDGPVTFSRIELEIPGFRGAERSTWGYVIVALGQERLVWSGMSEAGYVALSKVLLERRVAIQHVSASPYLLDNCVLYDEDWLPSLLVPARAANLETPRRLLRASDQCRNHLLARAASDGKYGYRARLPTPLRFTADQFSL